MKKILLVILLALSQIAIGQVTEAVDNRIDSKLPSAVKAEISKQLGGTLWDTVIVKKIIVNGKKNIDTIKIQQNSIAEFELYFLGVGNARAVMRILVTNNNGAYSVAKSNVFTWSGVGTAWTTTSVNNVGVIIGINASQSPPFNQATYIRSPKEKTL